MGQLNDIFNFLKQSWHYIQHKPDIIGGVVDNYMVTVV